MPSANANSLPVTEAPSSFSRPAFPQRLRMHLAGFIRRLLSANSRVAPTLPEELHGDIGFQSPLPERGEAFWQDRRRSIGRDLPL